MPIIYCSAATDFSQFLLSLQGKNADNRNNTLFMRIERKRNLQRLVNSRKNGQIKIITGVRRCGKSYLFGVLYRDYLYIQSALTVADEEKRQQEINSLNRIDDSYTKIVVVIERINEL